MNKDAINKPLEHFSEALKRRDDFNQDVPNSDHFTEER